jgi:hypothetical protein
MNATIVNPKALARTLFYAVTNSSQYGNGARMNDAVSLAMNFGLDTNTQERIGLTHELEILNWPSSI